MKKVFFVILMIALAVFIFSEEKQMKIIVNDGECVECKGGEWEGIDGMKIDLEDEIMLGSMIPDLTESQEKDIEKIKLDLRKATIDLNASIEKANIEIIELLMDDAKIDKLTKKVEEIGKLKTEIEKKNMEALFAVKAKLNDKQKKVLNSIGPRFFGAENKVKIMKKVFQMDKDEIEKDAKERKEEN